MKNEINELINKFKYIAEKGWIKSINKSFGSIGLTFENNDGKIIIEIKNNELLLLSEYNLIDDVKTKRIY